MRHILIFLLLLLFIILTLASSLSESPTDDEPGHISTGLLYLKYGNLTFNSGSPLLANVISASPLLFLSQSLRIPTSKEYFQKGYLPFFARDLLLSNRGKIDLILLLSRLPVMLAGALLGFVIFLWAKQWYGYWAGVLGLALYVSEPNIIAHSHYATTDIFFALFFTATLFFLQRFLLKKQKKYLILFIICFISAQLTKMTAIFLFPLCFLIFYFYSEEKEFINKIKGSFLRILILAVVSFIGINTFYGWRDLGLPLATYLRQDNSIVGSGYSLSQIESKLPFHGTQLGRVSEYLYKEFPLPITYHYVKTLGWVFFRSNIPQQAFLAGHYFDSGWKLYFPLVTIIKMPITLLFLFVISIVLFFTKKKRLKKEEFVFVVIPFIIFMFTLIFSRINTGYRLMIFLVPLIILFTSGLMKNLNKKYLVIFVVALQFFIIISNFPNFLGFANFIDPHDKYKYLTDSNLDWGQDVKKLASYIKDNKINNIQQNLYGFMNTELYNVPYHGFGSPWLKEGRTTEDCSPHGSGLYAISVSQLTGTYLSNHNCFSWLTGRGKLIDIIGSSIYIFRI